MTNSGHGTEQHVDLMIELQRSLRLLCPHDKRIGRDHCNECQIAGFCDCKECADHA